MCVETMETRPKHMHTVCLRRTTSPGPDAGWGLRCVTAAEDEALSRCGTSTGNMTFKKRTRREKRRARRAESSIIAGGRDKKMKRNAACVARLPPGAMAPKNTTQYLMSNVYDDMQLIESHIMASETASHRYDDYLSPRSVYAALDWGYESCLFFQQKDFDDLFDSY